MIPPKNAFFAMFKGEMIDKLAVVQSKKDAKDVV